MADLIQFRRDTAERWAEYNPVLAEGELGFVLGTANRYKIGDGVNSWNDLPLCGFNGNIVDEFGYDFNSVISQAGITAMFKFIVQKGAQIEINTSKGIKILDDFNLGDNTASKCGLYVLTYDNIPLYHMLVTGHRESRKITQWIFGQISIDNNGNIDISVQSKLPHIAVRTFLSNNSETHWDEWRYIQNAFISNNDINDLPEKSLSPSLEFFKNTILEVRNELLAMEMGIKREYEARLRSINEDIEYLHEMSENTYEYIKNTASITNYHSQQIEQIITKINNAGIVKFDGFINKPEGFDKIKYEHPATPFILFNIATKYFVAKSSGIIYGEWNDSNDYQNHSDKVIKNKVYIYKGDLYVFDDKLNFVKVGSTISCINVVSELSTAHEYGKYLLKNDNDEIFELVEYDPQDKTHIVITPEIGNIFICKGIFYDWDGRRFNPIGKRKLKTSDGLSLSEDGVLSLTERAKQMLFDDMWKAAVGAYGTVDHAHVEDGVKKPYYLNELWLTYEEAIAIMTLGSINTGYLNSYAGGEKVGIYPAARTNLPFVSGNSGAGGNSVGYFTSDSFGNSYLEIVRIPERFRPRSALGAFMQLFNGSRIHTVLGGVDLIFISSGKPNIGNTVSMENITFYNVGVGLNLSKAAKLTLRSVKSLLNRQGSATVIHTVHPDVYAKLMDGANTEWHQVLLDAIEKKIQFATT